MVRLVASDLDGTLLKDGSQELNPELFDMIMKLKEKGIHFAAASGRHFQSIRDLFFPIKDEISYITENGSLTLHNGAIITKGLIERTLGQEIIKSIQAKEGCNVMLSTEQGLFVEDKDARFLDFLTHTMKYEYQVTDNILDIPYDYLKIAVCNFDGTDAFADHFHNLFSSRIGVVTSGNIWVDFIAPNANKGSSLLALLDHLGITREECIAFGDQFNDIEMLEIAGKGYAMTTCAKGVEAYADAQVGSVEEILQELLL